MWSQTVGFDKFPQILLWFSSVSPEIVYWDGIHFRINGDAGRLLENIVRILLKVTSAIKHRKTAEEIISYAHRVYSLSLKLEKKQSIIFLLSLYHAARLWAPTLLLICVQFISRWEVTQIWWLWRGHENQAKFREFVYEEMLAFDFNNFMCIISLCIFILKFVQIPWPDVHMNNLEKCFYHFLKNFILLHKNTRLLKKRE